MIKPNKCIDCRVLIIKGSADRLNYRHLLSCENCQFYYQIQQCESISEIYGEEPPDCILLDWELCDRSSTDFLAQLSQTQLPLIILVQKSHEAEIASLSQDYLVKESLTPEFLDFAIHQAIAKAQLKQKLAEIEAKNKLLKQKLRVCQ
jgi:DNA-binding response OmpR family regulator